MISLSLMFLAGYGGMVSLADDRRCMRGYMYAIFGFSAVDDQPACRGG